MSNSEEGRGSFDVEAKRALLRRLKHHPPAETATTKEANLVTAEHRLESIPELCALESQLALFGKRGVPAPYFRTHEGISAGTTKVDGRELISFSSYNYLGLSGHPEVSAAAKTAIDDFGTSVSASRPVSGQRLLHAQLEAELALLMGAEDCVVFVSGHATNVATIGHLFGPRDLVVHDELAHHSIVQGCILSGAKRLSFAHNDCRALASLLDRHRSDAQRVLIAIEGAYSMDGDVADLPQFIAVKQRYQALLFVDEAHSLGVLGPTGAGIGEHFGVNRSDVDLWMGTLSKSLASCGGYIAGSAAVVKYLKYRCSGFIFSVGISPPNAAAALHALRIMRREPERVLRLRFLSQLFLDCARTAGLNTGLSRGTSVVPVIVGDSLKTLQLSVALFERGIDAQAIVHPVVPEGQERLRFFICVDHTEQQIRETVAAVAGELARLS